MLYPLSYSPITVDCTTGVNSHLPADHLLMKHALPGHFARRPLSGWNAQEQHSNSKGSMSLAISSGGERDKARGPCSLMD